MNSSIDYNTNGGQINTRLTNLDGILNQRLSSHSNPLHQTKEILRENRHKIVDKRDQFDVRLDGNINHTNCSNFCPRNVSAQSKSCNMTAGRTSSRDHHASKLAKNHKDNTNDNINNNNNQVQLDRGIASTSLAMKSSVKLQQQKVANIYEKNGQVKDDCCQMTSSKIESIKLPTKTSNNHWLASSESGADFRQTGSESSGLYSVFISLDDNYLANSSMRSSLSLNSSHNRTGTNSSYSGQTFEWSVEKPTNV